MAVPINIWAIIVSVIVAHVLGFLWFGPLFGKPWMRLMGISSDGNGDKKKMWKSIIVMTIGSLLMAFTMRHNIVFGSAYLSMTGISAGLQAGFWNWLGFIVPVSVGVVLWENKSWKLFFLNASYWLVNLLIMGMILSAWA